MDTKDNNYLKLIKGLKANNLSANEPNLKASSRRIESLLVNLKGKGGDVLDSSIDIGMNAIKQTVKWSSDNNPIDYYIEFGETYKYMLDDINNNKQNFDVMKKIASAYFDIADNSDDDRVKKVANSIADALEERENKLSLKE